jgi:uncharacterized protein YndB with AHSA1/START domain
VRESVQTVAGDSYAREVTCQAPRERVFAAVATIGGLRGWWTPIVAGRARAGGQLTFGFEGMDEAIAMRVDEVSDPARVRWTCLGHSSAADWSATTIQFELGDAGSKGCTLTFSHLGLPAEQVAAGWDHFLDSLTRLVETGQGAPFRAGETALDVARAYHHAWTAHDFDAARRLLAAGLATEVPINTYADRDDFAEAVASFGSLAERVDLVAEFGSGHQALLLYDMHTQPYGRLRVAEHFTVSGGLIQRIRHVHDTAVLRSAA